MGNCSRRVCPCTRAATATEAQQDDPLRVNNALGFLWHNLTSLEALRRRLQLPKIPKLKSFTMFSASLMNVSEIDMKRMLSNRQSMRRNASLCWRGWSSCTLSWITVRKYGRKNSSIKLSIAAWRVHHRLPG
jgi:hypothetical protein